MTAMGLLASIVSAAVSYSPTTTLGVDGTRFTINGQPTFLLGCSYYAALSASDEWIRRDLRELRDAGFNWIRVWATWSAYDNDISVVDSSGDLRQPWFGRLRSLVEFADALGMVVDITLSRGKELRGLQPHLAAARNLARALREYRNVYFDLGNERNVGDARYVSMGEVGQLIAAVKEVDPRRLATASHAGDIPEGELRRYVLEAKVDFIAPHRPRRPGSPQRTEAVTRHYIEVMKALGRVVPVHYQEPFRRNFNPHQFQPTVGDFLTDALGALKGGAAGWCLHIGDNRAARDRRPRKDFDMRPAEGRLFDQIDDVEREVIGKVADHLGLR